MTDRDAIARQQLQKNKSVVHTLSGKTQCTDEFCTIDAQNKLREAHVSRVHVRTGHKNKRLGPNANAISNMSSSGKTMDLKKQEEKKAKVVEEPKEEVKTQFRGMSSKPAGKTVPTSGNSVKVSSSHSNPVEASNKSKALAKAIEEQASKR
jgi:hypothetical protein